MEKNWWSVFQFLGGGHLAWGGGGLINPKKEGLGADFWRVDWAFFSLPFFFFFQFSGFSGIGGGILAFIRKKFLPFAKIMGWDKKFLFCIGGAGGGDRWICLVIPKFGFFFLSFWTF